MASRIAGVRRKNYGQALIRTQHWRTNLGDQRRLNRAMAVKPIAVRRPRRSASIHEFSSARDRSRSRAISAM